MVHRCGYEDLIKTAMSHGESKANNLLGLEDGVLYFVTRGLHIRGGHTDPRKKIQLFLGSNSKGSRVGPKSAMAAL